jgi:signal transduction histidine kinase
MLLAKPDIDERTRARLQRIQRAEQQCTDLISALLLLSRNERGHGATDVARSPSSCSTCIGRRWAPSHWN